MPSGEVLVAAALAGMIWFAGVGIVHGVEKVGKYVGKETKKAGTAIVHVIKKAV